MTVQIKSSKQIENKIITIERLIYMINKIQISVTDLIIYIKQKVLFDSKFQTSITKQVNIFRVVGK